MPNPNATHDLAEIDRIISEIKRSQYRPGWKHQTSAELRNRADYRRGLATAMKMQGLPVRKEYR